MLWAKTAEQEPAERGNKDFYLRSCYRRVQVQNAYRTGHKQQRYRKETFSRPAKGNRVGRDAIARIIPASANCGKNSKSGSQDSARHGAYWAKS